MKEVVFVDSNELRIYALKALMRELKGDDLLFHQVNTLQSLKSFLSEHPHSIIILNVANNFAEQDIEAVLSYKEIYTSSKWLLLFTELSEPWLKYLADKKRIAITALLHTDPLFIYKQAIQATCSSSFYLSESVSDLIKQYKETVLKSDSVLTNVERQILKEIASGKMTKEIASDRNVSTHTIVTHRKNIFRKLGINSIHEATIYAIKSNLIVVNDYTI